MSLYETAPGQNLDTAKGTLWGLVNAVTYYVDHVRSSGTGDRLDVPPMLLARADEVIE